jgi:hypothetical protein
MSQWCFYRKIIIYYSPFDFYKSSDKNSFFKTEFVSEDMSTKKALPRTNGQGTLRQKQR